MTDIKKKDLYLLLGVEESATAQNIRKAYRKKALKHHPDKNPNDEKAAGLFHELSEALKILTDVGARAAYDHVRNARKAAEARTAKWDEGRKRAKLDLDEREKAAENSGQKVEHNLEAEIRRLREQGSRILQEETDAIRRQLKTEAKLSASTKQPATLKVKWKLADAGNGLYSESALRGIFSKHGLVTGLVLGVKKKHGTAIVEFADSRQAMFAHDSEIGFPQCPLHVSWLSGLRPDSDFHARSGTAFENSRKTTALTEDKNEENCGLDVDELEELVFAKMRKKKEQANDV